EMLPPRLQRGSMAQAFMNSKIQSAKVVMFIKPTCPTSEGLRSSSVNCPSNKGFWNLSISKSCI
uniref:Uncharacterized protein n=1 Tax=Bos indicus x Bos taurus TaxID=30522 RepID=A0A4W2HT47_BOBOX